MFTVIDGATALLRKPKGVYVQGNLYRRVNTGQVFVKAAGGFVRILTTKWDDTWATSHPDYKVIAFDGFQPSELV